MDTKPLADLITFRTYGSWLHGDHRTSVDRYRNQYGTPKIPPNTSFETKMHNTQKQQTIILTKKHGDIILDAAIYACTKYNWDLFTIHVRTNHVHVTINSNRTPEHMVNQIKAYATRFLREKKAFSKDSKIWSRGCSVKYLWTPESLYFASEYTVERQGLKMAYLYGDLFERG